MATKINRTLSGKNLPPEKMSAEFSPYKLAILGALHKPVFEGAPLPGRVAKRRAKNRVAKQSRKANRA